MGKPFKVTLDLGGSEFTFDLTEEAVRRRAKRNPRIGAALASADGRVGLRTAAYQMCREMLDPSRDPDAPVHIENDQGVDLIPVHAIRRIRLDDPEVGDDKRPFGFTDPVDATPEGDAKVTPLPGLRGMRRRK